jgi:ABC-type glycerol-3-phosphate transport system substrate-binding protein
MKAVSKAAALALVLVLVLSGCVTHVHQVGSGAQGGQVEEEVQWYALWGLIELNEVDSNEMAGDADDYTITTQYTFVDALISMVTNYVTISRRTVMVEQ